MFSILKVQNDRVYNKKEEEIRNCFRYVRKLPNAYHQKLLTNFLQTNLYYFLQIGQNARCKQRCGFIGHTLLMYLYPRTSHDILVLGGDTHNNQEFKIN